MEEKTMKKFLLPLIALFMILVSVPAASYAVESIEMPVPPPEIEDIIEEMQTTYRLTIRYTFLDGTEAATVYTDQIDENTAYAVAVPEVDGYKPTLNIVNGIMPSRDMEITVIYIPNEPTGEIASIFPQGLFTAFLTILDYEVPLGLGMSMMNLGVCID